MLNKFIDLERLTTFFQGLKDIFLQKSEASTTYATKNEVENKVDKVEGKGLSTLDYNTSEKSKVDNSINQISVTQNTNNVELNLNKISGNATAYIDEATSTKAGALSNTDKAKLDEIPANPKYTDTIYVHPTNHSADMIIETLNKTFITEQERSGWNDKLNPTDVLSDAKVEVAGQQIGLIEYLKTVNDFKNSKGQAGGIAELDSTGKVPSSQLPPVQTYDLSPYATTDYVNTKNTVKVLDTRNEACTPLWYLENHGSNIMYELKSKTIVGDITKTTRAISVTSLSETTNDGIYVVGGMPNESYTTTNDYYMVATFIPLDQNGGYPMQILYSNPMAVRYGESNTLWGEWSAITTSDTKGVKTVLNFDDTTNDGIYVIGGQ